MSMIRGLEFDDRQLETKFQNFTHKMSQSGVSATASIFAFIVLLIMLLDFLYGRASSSRLILALAMGTLFAILAYFSKKMSIMAVRCFGYVLSGLVFMAIFTAKVYNPVLYAGFVTVLVFVLGLLLIRSFKINRIFLPISIGGFSMALWWKFQNLDPRPADERFFYFITLVIPWILFPLIMAYLIERELRVSFRLHHEIQDMLEQERLIFSRLSTGLILVKDGRVIWKNQACDRIFAKHPIELDKPFGFNWLNNAHNQHLKQWMGEIKSLQESDSANFTYFDTTQDPNLSQSLHVTRTWVMWERNREFLFIVTDCTAEEDANKFKYKWLSTVSHEFRTPLNIISNMMEILNSEKTKLSPTCQKFVDLGHKSTRLLKVHVGDLVDYCLLRNDKFYVSCQKFNLVELFQQSINLVEMKAADKKIDLQVDLQPFQNEITSDEDRIQQILINLLTNAIKFTKRNGKIRVVIKGKKPLGSKRVNDIQVQVSDNGIGIKVEDQEKLFLEYGRVVNEETNELNPQGVGLGLWICKRFCDELGSGISMKSEYGKGTTFDFTIRGYRKETPHSADRESRDTSSLTKTSRFLPADHEEIVATFVPLNMNRIAERVNYPFGDQISCLSASSLTDDEAKEGTEFDSPILIVDDEPFNRFVLDTFCRRMNLNTMFASDGIEALEMIESRVKQGSKTEIPFKLIILDYQMPRMTGPELAQRLAQASLEGKMVKPPIIGYTALVSKTELEYFLASGAIDILEMPSTFEKFYAMINHILR
eukprot:CAMPEP_0114978818 /NCGR_PEP_ID=MMETSP0216-20121206/4025_1 /TAXON_ID=223996 /ORGANISM="Protocruzia adherens, Strain Boccale" /LENGTH=763 /DNA_ID=CAMNT_0002340071 /DNA_START=63 /DNA_END=2351 /DNA_ORIENTATION=+